MSASPADKSKIPQAFWRVMESFGLPPSAILRQARLPSTLHLNPQSVFTTEQYFAVFRAVEMLVPDSASFAIELVKGAETSIFPPSALIAFYARDFRDALSRLVRYQRLCTPATLNVEEHGGQVAVSNHWLYANAPPPALSAYLSVVFTLELARRGTGQFIVPVRIEFARPDPNSPALRDHFACPIRYNAAQDMVVLNSADLDKPFPGHNPELLELLTPALATALSELEPSHTVREQVKHALKRHLTSGRPELSAIARDMGTSERTLQRRITEEGSTFRDLLHEARQELGRELLVDPSADINEVAWMLGYQDKSSFYRAFRDWEGLTPNQWRDIHGVAV